MKTDSINEGQIIRKDLMMWSYSKGIHSWFIEHLQQHNEQLRCKSISKEQLQNFIIFCENIANDREAAKSAGIKIGSWAYSDDDFKVIEGTARSLRSSFDKVLNIDFWDFYYCCK